jgi:hypothetical protein
MPWSRLERSDQPAPRADPVGPPVLQEGNVVNLDPGDPGALAGLYGIDAIGQGPYAQKAGGNTHRHCYQGLREVIHGQIVGAGPSRPHAIIIASPGPCDITAQRNRRSHSPPPGVVKSSSPPTSNSRVPDPPHPH